MRGQRRERPRTPPDLRSWVAGVTHSAAPELRRRLALSAAALVAGVATAGSLWFSLGWGLDPCTLCWYQRILMYPLVVVLGVAVVDDRGDVWRTALPLSILGGTLAAYHSFLQATASSCTFGTGTGGCGAVLYRLPMLGLTIPNLSLVAFLLITGLVVGAWLSGR